MHTHETISSEQSQQAALSDNTRTRLKAVLFDLDDTLFDHSYSARCGLIALREEHPCLQSSTPDELEHMYTRILDEVHLQVLAGARTIDDARAERMQRIFAWHGEKITREEALALAARFRVAYQESRQAVAGVIPLLKHLRPRVKIAIVTNNLLEEQRDKLRHCKLDGLIDELVTSEEAGITKPDPRIFEIALQRLACRPDEAVMIGDSWSSDIIGAQRAGLRALWFNRRGIPCPDPTLAREIKAFEPLEEILQLLPGLI